MFIEQIEIYEKDYFVYHLNREKERARRYRRHFSLLVLAVIQEKNGSNGGKDSANPDMGALISLIKSEIRCTDLFGKIDDHRVSTLLLEANIRHAKRIAERIQQTVQSNSLSGLAETCKSIFIGGVCYPRSEVDPYDFLNMSLSGGSDFLIGIDIN